MRRTLAMILLVMGFTTARGHEFWIEPSSFRPEPGELVKLKLLVGEHLAGDPVPRIEAWIDRFDTMRGEASTRVVGVDGSDPAGLLRTEGPGAVVVVYGGKPSYLEIEPARFDAYLDAEGLDAAKASRSKGSTRSTPGRERFTRCAKALLAVGGISGRETTTPVGLTLELVPESDPYVLSPGDPLVVRLLYRGKPLAKALVKAWDRARPSERLATRTDATGRARLALPRAGFWLVSAVHMVAVPDDPRAEWESFWASLTFEIAAQR